MSIDTETSSSPVRTRGWVGIDRLAAYLRPSWAGSITVVHMKRTRTRVAVPVMAVLAVAFVATVVGQYFVLRGLPAHLRPYCLGD